MGVVTAVCTVTTLSFSVTHSLDARDGVEVSDSSALAEQAPVTEQAPARPSAQIGDAAVRPAPIDPAPTSAEAIAEPEAPETPATTEPAPSAPTTAGKPSTPAAPAPAAAAVAAAPAPAAPAGAASLVANGTWMSGASGDGVLDGSFERWRGTPLGIAGTWADNNTAMTELWQFRPNDSFGSWDRPVDVAIGAIGDGESWQAAANGAYDERWRKSLTKLRDLRAGKPGTTFIRFAHEMNGDWYAWSVDKGDKDAFIAAWRKFRAMQEQIFPDAQLVFCVNRESVNTGFDWRQSFPGTQYVDVMAVDYYNQYPYVANSSDWAATVVATDKYGAPKGLQQHLDFARSVGLPLAVPEWSGNADNGDSAAWIKEMHSFFSRNAGGGAGQLLYEIQFNVDKDGRRWLLHGNTRMPASANAYRDAF